MKFYIENYKNYTIVPNAYLKDKLLSLTAKGLLSVMYSLPNDWDYTINGLCKITNSGITRIRNTIFELEMFGYLERKQVKNEKGQFDYEYYIFLEPKKNIRQNYEKSISKKRKNRI